MATMPTRLKEFFRKLVPTRLQLIFYNTTLNLHRRKSARPRPHINVRCAGDVFAVCDEVETMHIPTLRRCRRYRMGIADRSGKLAGKYGLPAEYEPKPGDTVVDIGANVGEFARYCAQRGASVYAFEPDPTVAKCLRRNVRTFALVRVLEQALWNVPKLLKFYCAYDTADSSLISPSAPLNSVLTLHALPLDQVAELAQLEHIDLIKIDGEGAEPEILEGARDTLAKTTHVSIDCGPERMGESTQVQVRKILRRAGFAIRKNRHPEEIFASRAV
jgi:FkbM family methyltransferase